MYLLYAEIMCGHWTSACSPSFFSSTGLVVLPDGMSNVDTKLTTLLSIQVTVVIGPLFERIDSRKGLTLYSLSKSGLPLAGIFELSFKCKYRVIVSKRATVNIQASVGMPSTQSVDQ